MIVAPADAYAFAQERDPYAVYENGRYLGRDTDPNIRLGLLRDAAFSDY
jgi:hypothetical protein